MQRLKTKARPHQRLTAKKRLFVEGFALLRRLAEGPLTRAEAENELGIPYREWYRWLKIFDEAGIPIASEYRAQGQGSHERRVRLWRGDWDRLIR